jgi:sigma-B regulation protein RsbU (phosphoserine phosphatase)
MPEVSSRTVTQVVAMPVVRPDGRFAGVTAIDVPFHSMFRELRLPAEWSGGAEAVLAVVPEGGGAPTILVQRDYQALGSDWRAPMSLEHLVADDPAALGRLLAEASGGQAAVERIPRGGWQALWACGPVAPGRPFPVVTVPYARIVAGAAEAERRVLERTARQLRTTGLMLLAFALVAAIVAVRTSRAVTGPVRRLADAARRLAAGDYDVRVEARGGDELAELSRAFNGVGPQLRERENLKASLAVAMEIQQKLLPQKAPELEGFEVAGRTVYCDETGGDYYDFIDLSHVGPGRLGIAVGDVSGHGIGAALIMASARGVLRSHADQYGDDLGGVLSALNVYLARDSSDERFMTLFYAVLNAGERTLEWTSGGHDPALWLQKSTGEIEDLPNTGMPIGMIEETDYGRGGPIKLQEGDVIIIGTDGIWEARSPDGEMFGKDRLRRLLGSMKDQSADDIRGAIANAVNEFKGTAPQLDDITLVVIRAV